MMTIGEMLRHFLTKLEWYSTLFPRIPVPIQKDIEKKLSTVAPLTKVSKGLLGKDGPAPTAVVPQQQQESRHIPDNEVSWGEAERISRLRRSVSRDRKVRHDDKKENGSSKADEKESREEEKHEEVRHRSRDDKKRRERRSSGDIADDIAREKERQKKDKDYEPDDYRRMKERRYRSRSRDRRRSRSHSRDRHYRDRHRRSHSRDRYRERRSDSRSRDRR